MDVVAIGQKVRLFCGIEGMVVAIMIEGKGDVSYKVAYPNGSQLCQEWIPDCLIEHAGAETKAIGFRCSGGLAT